MQEITIKTFGMVAEKMGCQELTLPGIEDTEQLLSCIYRMYPALERVKFAIAVNRKVVHVKTRLYPGSEIALLPPFSGG